MSTQPPAPVNVTIREEGNVTLVVVEASRLVRKLGFSEVERNRIVTSVSELARNILKYAEIGDVVVEPIRDGDREGVRIVASDEGPGIVDVDAALDDHYSTGGTLGLGLPGVRRLMHDFDVDTGPGKGTRVTATYWHRG